MPSRGPCSQPLTASTAFASMGSGLRVYLGLGEEESGFGPAVGPVPWSSYAVPVWLVVVLRKGLDMSSKTELITSAP